MDERKLIAGLAVGMLVVVALLIFKQDVKGKRPVPPDEILPGIPTIIGKLRDARDRSEDVAAKVKANSRKRRDRKKLPSIESLYIDARAKHNSCVSYIVASLDLKKRSSTRTEVESFLRSADSARRRFLESCGETTQAAPTATKPGKPAASGHFDPSSLIELADLILAIEKFETERISKQRDSIKKQLKTDCEWKEWSRL